MLLILVSERLPFCVTQLVLFHLVSVLFFWNQLTALSEGACIQGVRALDARIADRNVTVFRPSWGLLRQTWVGPLNHGAVMTLCIRQVGLPSSHLGKFLGHSKVLRDFLVSPHSST